MTTDNDSRIALERRIVLQLIENLAAEGWKLTAIDNGDGAVPTSEFTTTDDRDEEIFAADECVLRFSRHDRMHHVYLVFGNAPYEVVNDYSYSEADGDDFDAILTAHGEWAEAL